MSAAAAAIGGGAIGGYLGGRENRKGAQAAASASRYGADLSIGEQRRQFDLTREDMQPWRETGAEALGNLRALANGDFSKFYTSPGYQFRMDEGQKALERSAAARGNLMSGSTLKDLTRFGQGQASAEYGDYWNRLAGLAGVGQSANQSLGTIGAQTAGNIGNIAMANAANQGNAALAGAQARGSMYQGLGTTLGQLGAYGQQNGWFGSGGGGNNMGFGSDPGFSSGEWM